MSATLKAASGSYIKDITLALLLFTGAYFAYSSYLNFFNADWTFDDERVFSSLPNISNFKDAFEFIKDAKEISPVGRPLALASFLLNISDWPDNSSGFRRINTFFHIINGFLLALVTLRVARYIPKLNKNAFSFSIFVSIAWLLHPFLASTSFHAIQRMTILATTFSLLCLLFYLHGRSLLTERLYRGLGWMTLGLLIPGLLAILSKETAVLIPLLIAVLELIILNYYRPIEYRAFRLWRLIFFGFPAIFLIIFSIHYLSIAATETYLTRPFTLTERLLSESVILIEYIRQILLPNISKMGPFQDDTSRILGLSPYTFFAVAFWIILTIVAVAERKRIPLFSFAVLFFLVSHFLESTFFGLELYFEHRNYMPSAAIIASLFAIAWTTSIYWPKIIASLYILLLGGLLWSVTMLWGHPLLGPIAWAEAHPTSVRATQVLTTMYWNLGQVDKAKETILNGYKSNPDDSNLATNALTYQCFSDKSKASKELTDTIVNSSSTLGYGRSVTAGIHTILQLFSEGNCNQILPEQLIRYTQGFLSNPKFIRKDEKKAFYLLISRLADIDNKPILSLEAKAQAFLIEPWPGGMEHIYCQMLDIEKLDAAFNFLQDTKSTTATINCIPHQLKK